MSSKFLCNAVLIFWFIANCTGEKGDNNLQTNHTNSEPYFRVKNGEPAVLGEVPYQIAFSRRVSSNDTIYWVFCGGALVGPTAVLTAGHCFAAKRNLSEPDKEKVARSYAVAGTLLNGEYVHEVDSVKHGQWRRIKQAILSKKYMFPRNDICVVITVSPFVYNKYVQPIPYSKHFKEYTGRCLLSGYGKMEDNRFSKYLQVADLEIIPNSECAEKQKRNMKKFICTSNDESDAAKGDSGGPLVCRNTGDPSETERGLLVGVVSGQTFNIRSHTSQTYYTRISAYYDFVKKNTYYEDDIDEIEHSKVRVLRKRKRVSKCYCFKADYCLISFFVLLNLFIGF